jgi:hypothetical protein
MQGAESSNTPHLSLILVLLSAVFLLCAAAYNTTVGLLPSEQDGPDFKH